MRSNVGSKYSDRRELEYLPKPFGAVNFFQTDESTATLHGKKIAS